MGLRQVELTTCFGEKKLADKLSIFLEIDRDGNPFYKIEGSCSGITRFAVELIRDKDAAMERFRELAELLLEGQRQQEERFDELR